MKIIFATLLISLVSGSAFAARYNSLCGVNKKDGEQIRLAIVLDKEDEFSDASILTVDGAKPRRAQANGAGGFGPHGYENITLKLNDNCSGTAVYKHFDADQPMNPMEDLQLKCVCK